jgi:competence protein ComEA
VGPDQVDINTADIYTLQRVLDGVGEKKARAIVRFREEHGPFKTVYDLSQVYGMGEKLIETNKARIVVSDPQAATVPATTTTPTPATPPVTPSLPATEPAEKEPAQAQ